MSIVKPCFSMVSTKSIDGAVEVGRAHPVDDDGDAVEVGDDVAVEVALVEEQLVAQTGAAAGLDGDPQLRGRRGPPARAGSSPCGGGVAEVDPVGDGSASAGGLDLLGHLWAPWTRSTGRQATSDSVQWSHIPGYSQAPPSARRRGSSARPGARRPLRQRGQAARRVARSARSSPTRSTMEYADSTPSARISREPTRTCPASAMHGRSASAATAATPYGTLPRAGGEVERALAGDHQVGARGPGRPARRPRRPRRARASRVAPSSSSAKPRPAGGAGALRGGDACRSRPRAARAARRPPAAGPRARPSAGRTRWSRRAARAAGCRRRWPRPARRRRRRSRAAARSTASTSPRPAAPPVSGRPGGGGPERGEQARRRRRWCPSRRGRRRRGARRRPCRARRARPRPYVVARSGALGRSGQMQPAGLRALDVRRAATTSTAPGTGSPYGPGTVTASSSPPSDGVQHVDEAGAAVGHRDQVELVVGRVPAPALGDRLGRLDGGERAGELVGGDQHAHASHPAATCFGVAGASGRRRDVDPADDARTTSRAAERLTADAASTSSTVRMPPARLARAASTARRARRRAGSPAIGTWSAPTRGGCWVAEDDGGVIGVAVVLRAT